MKRSAVALGLLLILSGMVACSLDPIRKGSVDTGTVSFARFHVVGNSLTAGFQNGGLVEAFQRVSYGAMIAQAAGAPSFQAPFVSEPGLPPTLFVSNFNPVTLDTLGGSGTPTNSTYAGIYNNLGVPGATLHDILTARPTPGTLFELVLRDSTLFGGSTVAAQAVAAQPTLLLVWIGANDALGSATQGTDALLTPAAQFESDYRTLMDMFVGAADHVVAANVPDVASAPFFTAVPPVLVDPATRQPILVGGSPVPLIGIVQGAPGPLPPGTVVTLPAASLIAQGIGVDTTFGGTGQPLPDAVILDPTELANIRARVDAFNTIIDTVCANRGIPVVDIFSFFNRIGTEGARVRGETFHVDYLTGGLFGIDGIHPSTLGYWVVAREFIRTINAAFGASIPDPKLPAAPVRDPGLGFGPNPNVLAAAQSLTPAELRGTWRALGVDVPAELR